MTTENYKRVHIIGSGGSGKTTLARKLAVFLNAPCYELDHVGYENGNGAERSLSARYEDVRRIASQPTWVSEGGFVWWVDDLLQSADAIVWLDLHWTICYRRIVMRHIRADIAGNNLHPGFLKMLRFAKGVRPYYLDPEPAVPSAADDDARNNRAAVAQVLGPYSDKIIHCRRPADVTVLLSQVGDHTRVLDEAP